MTIIKQDEVNCSVKIYKFWNFASETSYLLFLVLFFFTYFNWDKWLFTYVQVWVQLSADVCCIKQLRLFCWQCSSSNKMFANNQLCIVCATAALSHGWLTWSYWLSQFLDSRGWAATVCLFTCQISSDLGFEYWSLAWQSVVWPTDQCDWFEWRYWRCTSNCCYTRWNKSFGKCRLSDQESNPRTPRPQSVV